MPESEVRIIDNDLFVDINFEGLENLKKISANKVLKVEVICTDKTKVIIKILES